MSSITSAVARRALPRLSLRSGRRQRYFRRGFIYRFTFCWLFVTFNFMTGQIHLIRLALCLLIGLEFLFRKEAAIVYRDAKRHHRNHRAIIMILVFDDLSVMMKSGLAILLA